MALFTITKGTSPTDCITFHSDDIKDTKSDAPYVVVSINVPIRSEDIERALQNRERETQ